MRFTKTQAFEHRAREMQYGEKDLMDKFHLIDILRRRFGLHGLTGEILCVGENRYRLPDVLVKYHMPIYAFELDGYHHEFGDKVSESQHDRERGEDYATRKDVVPVVINKRMTEYQEDEIVKICVSKGMELLI